MKGLLANRKIFIVLGAAALLLFGVGYLFMPGVPKPIQIQLQIAQPVPVEPTPTPEPEFEEGPVAPVHHIVPKGNGIMFPLGERIVNLADPGGYRYLRTSIVLEFLPESAEFYRLPAEERSVVEEEFKAKLTRQKAVIDDTVISILSSKTFEDIFTMEGKERLKQEIMDTLNQRLGEGKYIGAVYFTDFVVQ
ncbi:MAG: hypothetical protein Kow0047_03920 [Anaerolineae bacterium]